MNPAILLELAARWERDANEPMCVNAAPVAQRGNDIADGIRQGKRECADSLRSLITLLA
jgi:hypothetical protein